MLAERGGGPYSTHSRYSTAGGLHAPYNDKVLTVCLCLCVCCAALPSMSLLSEREIGAADMVDLTALALGERPRGRCRRVYRRRRRSGKQAELVTLRLPDMQPLYATRFSVPSAVSNAFFDAASGWLYLLCAAAQPRVVRLRITAASSADVGRRDGLALPWAAAAMPLLLPFPEQRQLLVFGAASAVEASDGGRCACAASASAYLY